MSKNEVRTDISDPSSQNENVDTNLYTETTSLGGPRPYFGTGPAPCNLLLSREVLQASGLWAGYEVELVARPGVIEVKLIGAPKPSVLNTPRPTTNPGVIDQLMEVTRERLARQKFAREGGYLDVGDEEGEEPLSEEQTRQEAL